MNNVRSALGFLIWRSLVNRVRQQMQRLRQPRYAIGLVLVLIYFGMIFLVPLLDDERAPRLVREVAGGIENGTGVALTISGVVLFLLVAGSWLLKGRGQALAFQPAEVGLLFPAPLSRRALLLYRLGQIQVMVLLNALILALLSGRTGSGIPFWQRTLGGWLFVTALLFHQMGLALLRVEPLTPGRRLALRGGRVVVVLAIAIVGLTLAQTMATAAGLSFADTVRVLGGALSEGAAGVIMAPFTWIMAPTGASGTALVGALAGSLAVIGALLVWVLRGTIPFEEAAATASAAQATALQRLRDVQRGRGTLFNPAAKAGTRSLPLAPVGPPWRALVWKNTLAMLRTRMYVSLLIMAVGALVFAGMASRISRGPAGSAAAVLTLVLVTATAMLTLLGMSALRNDLRTDMAMLGVIKTWPLPGQTLLLGQIMSPALTITLVQGAVLVLGTVLFGSRVDIGFRPAVIAPGLVLLAGCFVLNLLALTIQSGTAVLFPGWVHLGVEASGIETIGQRILMGVGTGVAISLLVLVPGVVGVLAGWLVAKGFAVSPEVATLVGGLVGLLLLALEVALLIDWLGERFERTEAAAVL